MTGPDRATPDAIVGAWEDEADERVDELGGWNVPEHLERADLARVAIALRRIARAHADAAALVDARIVELTPRGDKTPVLVDGTEVTVRRTARRTGWQSDDLLRAVLDSRLVDTETGEIADETPTEKILHVWNLGAPRTKALKARGIDPDEYATTEWSSSVQYR